MKWLHGFVYGHGVVAGDVFFCLRNVACREHNRGKFRIGHRRQDTGGDAGKKDDERPKKLTPGIPHGVGQFVQPEGSKSFLFAPFVFVYGLENLLCQVIEIDPYRTVGVIGARVGKVVGGLNKQVGETVGVFGWRAEHAFEFMPLILVLPDEFRFLH